MTRRSMELLGKRQDERTAPLRLCCSASEGSPSERKKRGMTEMRWVVPEVRQTSSDRGRLATTRPRCVSPTTK